MSVTRLPNGRWRARVHHDGGFHSVAKVLGHGPSSFRTKREGEAAEAKAKAKLERRVRKTLTVREFWGRWTTDPLFARPKESTMIHNRERTKKFVDTYGDVRIAEIDDEIVAEWLAGGRNVSTVPALRAMFTDASKAISGRLVTTNPFAGLGLSRSRYGRRRGVPTRDQMEHMVAMARELTPPSFAAYFEFACLTAARPGELDALRWKNVRFDLDEVEIVEQWNAKSRTFTDPKYGSYSCALVERAGRLLRDMPRSSMDCEFVFVTNRGTHYTPSSRTHHWNRVRCAAGFPEFTLYVATRHYFASYALNVLELQPHVIAAQLGHRDGGRLIVERYGHPDDRRARRQIKATFDRAEREVRSGMIREAEITRAD